VKKAIFDFGIADSGLNILNPHKRAGAVGIPLMVPAKKKPDNFNSKNG
jgi:hypothetical protein